MGSNVVQIVLQAFAQVPDLNLFFGPDTYMGSNLETLFRVYAEKSDEEIAAIHPAHNQATLRSLLPRFHYFKQGTCVVHHMFGGSVTERVRRDLADAYHTAHLEVPGEMFEVAMESQLSDRGVVGSTSDILKFIVRKTMSEPDGSHLKFVLGTEASMITPIVRQVEEFLAESGSSTKAEIVFPVASEAVAQTDDELGVVPGVLGGEGCTTAGGCATCPYMKMNDLDKLLDVAERRVSSPNGMTALLPRAYAGEISGMPVGQAGVVPIDHMREFQALGQLGGPLVKDINNRHVAC